MSLTRRRTLTLLASLAAGSRAAAQNADGPALRAELERNYVSWLQAMRSSDTASFAAQTSRYRQMCLRNEVISMRQPWPAAVFKSTLQAPDVSRLTFVDATAWGDTARVVYFGRVDFALESTIMPENPLILRFLKENGAWKFDWIQYVNLGADEETRRAAKSGARSWLDSPEFLLTGQYPAVPKACRQPYQIAALSILAQSCKVTVDINQGTHVETVQNNTGGRIITGGLQKGVNQITITPALLPGSTLPAKLEISILTRRESYSPPVRAWTWKPPEAPGQWKPKYDATVFVKSRTAVQ